VPKSLADLAAKLAVVVGDTLVFKFIMLDDFPTPLDSRGDHHLLKSIVVET
jgi:hypothetical protein